jgi:hypothetical protein
MLKYITAEEMIDCAEAQFFDDVAEGLHDRTVYDYIKKNVMDLHPSALTGLLESLDGHDMQEKVMMAFMEHGGYQGAGR